MPAHLAPANQQHTRIELFDALRGFALICMVGFHLCYDLRYLCHMPGLEWFGGTLEEIWRVITCWTFIIVAGCMCLLTRSNYKRACKYLVVAAAVWLVTYFAKVDTPISFGIIYCMGACTLIAALLETIPVNRRTYTPSFSIQNRPAGAHFQEAVSQETYRTKEFKGLLPRGYIAAAILFVIFLALQDLKSGSIWAFGLNLTVPEALYQTPYLSWLGFPDNSFSSGDYYPLLPFVFLYFTGTALMARWYTIKTPAWIYVRMPACFKWLPFIGRYSLWIYIAHQPVILGILMLSGLL